MALLGSLMSLYPINILGLCSGAQSSYQNQCDHIKYCLSDSLSGTKTAFILMKQDHSEYGI